MEHRQRPDDAGAPVVTDEDRLVVAEVVEEADEVVGKALDV